MTAVKTQPSLLDSSSLPQERFSKLRGVRWRIGLGVLPSSPPASVNYLRRAVADARRRFVSLRRRVLKNFHLPKDGERSSDLTMDNPLSQNPDSTWSRFFKTAELDKLIDQDLSQWYLGHDIYFQTPECQSILRRVLLLWCLQHPNHGYRREMHELLVPLVYGLHVDLDHLSQMQKVYENGFSNDTEEMSFPELDQVSVRNHCGMARMDSIDGLDPDSRDILLLTDSYGAEGELGVLLSKRFLEHDAYCMFDSLMNGTRGVVAMADVFFSSPSESNTEASSSIYHLLSVVDSDLHSHLVELGVEPQYFAIRWLRVLFGREYSFGDLLMIWDELFSSPNDMCIDKDAEFSFRILCAPRGALIVSMAVAMLLHLRSSLLATENATTCLRRLLDFPKSPDMKILIGKAKSLQILAIDSNIWTSSPMEISKKKLPRITSGYSFSSQSTSLRTPLTQAPGNYWEERWKVLHKEEAITTDREASCSSGMMKFLGERSVLSRAESNSHPACTSGRKNGCSSVRRSLTDDFVKDINPVVDFINSKHNKIQSSYSEIKVGNPSTEEEVSEQKYECINEETCCSNGESSLLFSAETYRNSIQNHDYDSHESSIASNSSISNYYKVITETEEHCHPQLGKDAELNSAAKDKSESGQLMVSKDEKPFTFQWFWKFSRDPAKENMDIGGSQRSEKSSIVENIKSSSSTPVCAQTDHPSGVSEKVDIANSKVLGTLKTLGQSMLENIQVIETVFQQECVQSLSLESLSSNILGGKGQVAAVSALKELRKMSSLLSEM